MVKKEILIKSCFFFLVPILFYFSIFTLHFYLLPFECQANCGCVLELPKFLKPISLTEWYSFFNHPSQKGILGNFLEEHKKMLEAYSGAMEINWPFASDWYTWPLMLRPVVYFGKWADPLEEKGSVILLLGNPLVWWLCALGVIAYFYLLIRWLIKEPQNLQKFPYYFSPFLIFGYLSLFLIFSSIKRFMIIYSYFPALIFSMIIFSLFLDTLLTSIFKEKPTHSIFYQNKFANFIFIFLILLIIGSFIFFSPLSYGIPLTEEGFGARLWMDIWSIY